MLSPLFKVRDFAVTDFTQQGIEVAWQQQQQATSTTDNDDVEGCSSIIKRTEVFPPRSTLNTVKMLTFYRKEAFELWAQYTNSEDHGDDASLGRYTIQVPHNSENDEGPKKIKVRAKLSLHGTFSIENAIMIEEEEYQVVEKERRRRRPINKETNDDENMVDASPSAAAATTTITNDDVNMQPAEAPAAPAASGISSEKEGKGDEFEEDEEEELVEVTKIKTRTKKTDIPIIRSGLPGMSEDRLRAAEDDELKMRNIDREVAETDEKRNELESYIFESSAAQREELSNILMQTEDWVYDHYEATKAEYMDKLIEIRALGDGAESRAMEASLRPEAEARAQDVIQKYRSLAQSPDIAYAHIAIERKEYILEECHKLESWLSQQKALQVRQPLYLQPVYTVSQLNDKTDALIKLADGILSEKPPSSPPSSKKAQDESAESNSKEEERGSPEPIVEEPDDSSDDQDGEEEEEEVAKDDDHHHHMDVD
ncbi:Cg4 protein, putative [Perkinsus marinus ATCC 50983]|uniref:Cg4 protein, putative n=1 Tax=Perkinsus marinus (strain ATCC 50983 / TXsc) TaxID=423536 RepID=C5KFG1_PERM5|nr:Cg4 protein, putative [Perkinsus marinus ATCC 50983]EER16782.1 Cg4 protein, putative [Perkinsus marinus ATCC 50983]|eukprot:XP_002784986.1 Cg4 protein, putative [Perkinsus marinus ATCC 50983]